MLRNLLPYDWSSALYAVATDQIGILSEIPPDFSLLTLYPGAILRPVCLS